MKKSEDTYTLIVCNGCKLTTPMSLSQLTDAIAIVIEESKDDTISLIIKVHREYIDD